MTGSRPKGRQQHLVGVAFVLVLLAACASGPGVEVPAQDVISGTLTAPAGYDVQGARVFLCSETSCVEREIQQSGSMGTFSFEGLAEGAYQLTAFKVLEDETFLSGCHGAVEDLFCAPASLSPPQEDVAVEMVHIELPGTPDPPPAELRGLN